MIPTVLVAGLLVGRLWFVPLAAAGWALLIAATNGWDAGMLPGAALFGGANAAVGVGARRAFELAVDGVVWSWRAARGRPSNGA